MKIITIHHHNRHRLHRDRCLHHNHHLYYRYNKRTFIWLYDLSSERQKDQRCRHKSYLLTHTIYTMFKKISWVFGCGVHG